MLVDAATHSSNLRIFADWLIEREKDKLQDSFPGKGVGKVEVSPQMPLSGRERLAFYTQITLPEDFGLLVDEYYTRKARRGLLPLPASPYWLNLWNFPQAFWMYQQDFIQVMKAAVKQLQPQVEQQSAYSARTDLRRTSESDRLIEMDSQSQ
jgi:hypothetical protein